VSASPDIDGLSLEALKALVVQLLSKVTDQERVIAELREENARLKGLNGRPRIKPSGMVDTSNDIRAASARGDYWEQRVSMLQWWADELDRLRGSVLRDFGHTLAA
jgi:hypothetical protein